MTELEYFGQYKDTLIVQFHYLGTQHLYDCSLKAVLHVQPNTTRAEYALALVYLELQKIPEAETLLHNVLESEPTHESARLSLGQLYYKEKQYRKGVDLLSKFLEQHTLNEEAVALIARCYIQLQQFKQAEEMYKLVIKVNPQRTEALYGLGMNNVSSYLYLVH